MPDDLSGPSLRIGQLAAELGLNPRTIRYYEAIGLLPPPQRSPAGYRLFGAADRDRLRFIVKARDVGLSLTEIAEMLALRAGGACPCDHLRTVVDRKLATVEARIQALTAFRDELLALRSEAAAPTGDARICSVIEWHEPAHDLHAEALSPYPSARALPTR